MYQIQHPKERIRIIVVYPHPGYFLRACSCNTATVTDERAQLVMSQSQRGVESLY